MWQLGPDRVRAVGARPGEPDFDCHEVSSRLRELLAANHRIGHVTLQADHADDPTHDAEHCVDAHGQVHTARTVRLTVRSLPAPPFGRCPATRRRLLLRCRPARLPASRPAAYAGCFWHGRGTLRRVVACPSCSSSALSTKPRSASAALSIWLSWPLTLPLATPSALSMPLRIWSAWSVGEVLELVAQPVDIHVVTLNRPRRLLAPVLADRSVRDSTPCRAPCRRPARCSCWRRRASTRCTSAGCSCSRRLREPTSSTSARDSTAPSRSPSRTGRSRRCSRSVRGARSARSASGAGSRTATSTSSTTCATARCRRRAASASCSRWRPGCTRRRSTGTGRCGNCTSSRGSRTAGSRPTSRPTTRWSTASRRCGCCRGC